MNNAAFKIPKKKLKLMYIVNLEKKLPNKNLRTVFTPDNLSSPLNDFPIFITSGVLQITFTFYPICIVLEKWQISNVHKISFLSVIIPPKYRNLF